MSIPEQMVAYFALLAVINGDDGDYYRQLAERIRKGEVDYAKRSSQSY